MPNLAAALNKHHSKLAEMHSGVISYAGTNYTVPVGVTAAEVQLQDGGTRPGEQLEARISKTVLATAPKARETVGHQGAVFVIESVRGLEAWAREWVVVAVR